MFRLNIKVAAFMLANILVVHGRIFQEDKFVMDSNHVESYHKFYSDNDRSDVFDKTDSLINIDGPELDREGSGEELPNTNTIVEANIERNQTEESIGEDPKGPNLEHPHSNLIKPRPFVFDFASRLLHVNDEVNPRPSQNQLYQEPSVAGESGIKYSGSKPDLGEMTRKCQNIKGLPKPDSGCCGVQMTGYPIEKHHGRFTRSADRDTLPSGMITGGNVTDLYQFPWMVRLTIDNRIGGFGSLKSCGGTIISRRFVITAAHCLFGTFQNLSQITVILAEYDSNVVFPEKDCDGKECVQNQIRHVERIFVNKDFNYCYLQSDVALVKLTEDIVYSDYIRPICLPTQDIADYSEQPLIIAGWGLNGKAVSNVKRSAVVNYVPEVKCKEEYSYKTDSTFCSIGGHGEDICSGDSGGPLMVHSNGKFFLSGIISGKRSNEECGSTVPSLFTNVFYHLYWIQFVAY